jgi:hypothetical protein
LERHYPGWEWLIGVEKGCMVIHSFKLSTKHGYRLFMDKLDND